MRLLGGSGASANALMSTFTSWTRPPTPAASELTAARDGGSHGASASREPGHAYLLGRHYEHMPPGGFVDGHPLNDRQARERQRFLADLYSRVWFSYRKLFPALGPTRLTSDTGWGCMLRSGQMLLCQALMRHFVGDKWALAENEALPESFDAYRLILSWFHDSPLPTAPYSIHNMAELGEALQTPVGQWHGPTSTAHIIAALVNKHSPNELGCVVCSDAVVYEAEVRAAFDGGAKALLLLLPLRLGVELNTAYLPSLQAFFTHPQSLGFAGGKVGSSIAARLGSSLRMKRLRSLQSMYFVGCDSEQAFYCLDPHTTQAALAADPRECTQEQLVSFHCVSPRRVAADGIDPSLLLGVYLRDMDDFADWARRVAALKPCPFLVSGARRAPSAPPRDVDVMGDSDDQDEPDSADADDADHGEVDVAQAAAQRAVAGLPTGIAPFGAVDQAALTRLAGVRCKELATLQAADGDVRGLLVVTPRKVHFEPLQQEPLVRARGRRPYRFTVDLASIAAVRVEDEPTEEVLRDDELRPHEQYVLLSASVANVHSAGAAAAAPRSSTASLAADASEANLRRAAMSEASVRAVLLDELQAAVKALQVRLIASSAVGSGSAHVGSCDADVRVIVERIELVLRHGIRESVGLFGRRSAPLLPILNACAPRFEMALLREHCGAAPDDAFVARCWIRVALTNRTLVMTCERLHNSAQSLGYEAHALMALPDQWQIFESTLRGLDVFTFRLPIVDVPLDSDEEDNEEVNDSVDIRALVDTTGYAFDAHEERRGRILRIEARALYLLRLHGAQRMYQAIVDEMKRCDEPRQPPMAPSSEQPAEQASGHVVTQQARAEAPEPTPTPADAHSVVVDDALSPSHSGADQDDVTSRPEEEEEEEIEEGDAVPRDSGAMSEEVTLSHAL